MKAAELALLAFFLLFAFALAYCAASAMDAAQERITHASSR